MTGASERHEEHVTAEEDNGSAELQPEDGGSASPPSDEPEAEAEEAH